MDIILTRPCLFTIWLLNDLVRFLGDHREFPFIGAPVRMMGVGYGIGAATCCWIFCTTQASGSAAMGSFILCASVTTTDIYYMYGTDYQWSRPRQVSYVKNRQLTIISDSRFGPFYLLIKIPIFFPWKIEYAIRDGRRCFFYQARCLLLRFRCPRIQKKIYNNDFAEKLLFGSH